MNCERWLEHKWVYCFKKKKKTAEFFFLNHFFFHKLYECATSLWFISNWKIISYLIIISELRNFCFFFFQSFMCRWASERGTECPRHIHILCMICFILFLSPTEDDEGEEDDEQEGDEDERNKCLAFMFPSFLFFSFFLEVFRLQSLDLHGNAWVDFRFTVWSSDFFLVFYIFVFSIFFLKSS